MSSPTDTMLGPETLREHEAAGIHRRARWRSYDVGPRAGTAAGCYRFFPQTLHQKCLR
jgi:hypothetical protein